MAELFKRAKGFNSKAREPGVAVLNLVLAVVSSRSRTGKSEPADSLTREYLERAARYTPTELKLHQSEESLLTSLDRRPGCPAATALLFDSGGDQLSSIEFAHLLGKLQGAGVQRIVFGIGGPDGWTELARKQAKFTLSVGRMTLPHELARVVVAEQIYRALTILAGHPYHQKH